MIGSLYYNNKSLIDPSYDGIVYAGNHVALNMDGDSGQYIEITVEVGEYYTLFDVETKMFKTFNHLGEEQI